MFYLSKHRYTIIVYPLSYIFMFRLCCSILRNARKEKILHNGILFQNDTIKIEDFFKAFTYIFLSDA